MARVRNSNSEAMALRAGAGRHDLPEERTLNMLDVTAAAAHVAGHRLGARRCSRALTHAASHRGVEGQLTARPEGGFGQLEVDLDQGVLTAHAALTRSARRRLTEKRVHDVAEAEGTTAWECCTVHAEVIALAALRVRQHLVGSRDFFEPVFGFGVDVGVQLSRELAIGTLDLVLGRLARHTQCVVVVAHGDSSRMRPTYWATA